MFCFSDKFFLLATVYPSVIHHVLKKKKREKHVNISFKIKNTSPQQFFLLWLLNDSLFFAETACH